MCLWGEERVHAGRTRPLGQDTWCSPGQRHSPAAPAAQPWPAGTGTGSGPAGRPCPAHSVPVSGRTGPQRPTAPITHLGSPNPTSDAPTPPRDNCSQSPLRGSLGRATPRRRGRQLPCKHPNSRQGPLRTGTPCRTGARPQLPALLTVRTSGLNQGQLRCCECHGPAQPPPCREPCLPPRQDPTPVQVPGTRNMGGRAPVSRAVQELREEGTGAPCLVFRTAVQTGRKFPSQRRPGGERQGHAYGSSTGRVQ